MVAMAIYSVIMVYYYYYSLTMSNKAVIDHSLPVLPHGGWGGGYFKHTHFLEALYAGTLCASMIS